MTLTDAIASLVLLQERVAPAAGSVILEDRSIVLRNPEAKGAVTVGMMVELGRAVATLVASPPLTLVLRSEGQGTFCSGGHLAQVRGALGEPEAGREMSAAMTVVLDTLARLPSVVIAQVDGPALGGGAELVTACDLVVAHPTARIGFVHAGLGVTTGWGGAFRLARRVGQHQALRLLVTRQVLRAREAQQIGLVDEVAPTVEHAVLALRDRIEGGDPEAVRAFKSLTAHWQRQDNREAEVFSGLWGGSAHRERLAAALRRSTE